MKKLVWAAALALVAVPAQAADPVEGLWQTEVDDGAYAHVRVAPCKGDTAKICGTIVQSFNADGAYQSPNTGKDIIRAMVPTGGGKYEGQVWRPSSDKIYIGKLELNGNRLKMKGCVAGGLFCASQTWARVQ